MKIDFRIIVVLGALLMTACKSDEATPERNQLKIWSSEESIVLHEDNINDTALTFTWNTAQEIGAEYSFTYILQLDIANNSFKTAIDPIEVAEGVFSYSFTAGQLYDYIVERWHGVAGQSTPVEARIVAKVNGPKFMYPEIATTQVVIQTYLPESQPLYILGTATTAGWDAARAIPMNEISNGKIYSWRGNLVQGTFKFITAIGEMLPSLNRGEQDSLLVWRNSESEPDDCFSVNQSGMYYIYLSKKEMKISVSFLKYQHVYLIGNATTAEWDINNAIEMTPDPITPSIFTIQTALKEGELKLPTEKLWDAPTFRPMQANGSITDENTQVISAPDGPNDLKWYVTAAQVGTYSITLDTENNKIYFVKL